MVRASDAGAERAVDSCRFDGDTLVLSYRYAVNEFVSLSLDATGADVVVDLRVTQGSGSSVANGYPSYRTAAMPGRRSVPRERRADRAKECDATDA